MAVTVRAVEGCSCLLPVACCLLPMSTRTLCKSHNGKNALALTHPPKPQASLRLLQLRCGNNKQEKDAEQTKAKLQLLRYSDTFGVGVAFHPVCHLIMPRQQQQQQQHYLLWLHVAAARHQLSPALNILNRSLYSTSQTKS